MNFTKIDLMSNNTTKILPSVYSEAMSYSDMLGKIIE